MWTRIERRYPAFALLSERFEFAEARRRTRARPRGVRLPRLSDNFTEGAARATLGYSPSLPRCRRVQHPEHRSSGGAAVSVHLR